MVEETSKSSDNETEADSRIFDDLGKMDITEPVHGAKKAKLATSKESASEK